MEAMFLRMELLFVRVAIVIDMNTRGNATHSDNTSDGTKNTNPPRADNHTA